MRRPVHRCVGWLFGLAVVLICCHLVLAQDHCDVHAKAGIDVTLMPRPPELPLVVHNALPGEGWVLGRWKIKTEIRIYNSWESGRHTIATLRRGGIVTALEGLNVIHEPDVIVVSEPIPTLNLASGDKMLRYRSYGEGEADF